MDAIVQITSTMPHMLLPAVLVFPAMGIALMILLHFVSSR